MPMKPDYIAIIDFSTLQWIFIEILVIYIGLNYLKKIESKNKTNVFKWIRNWPGWIRSDSSVSDNNTTTSNVGIVAIPTIAATLSIIDFIDKVVNVFPHNNVVKFAFTFTAFLMVVCSIGFAFHSLTATIEVNHPIVGHKRVSKFSNRTRFVSLASAVFVFFIWGLSSSYEPISDLQILSTDSPNPEDREVSIVIVNRGKTVRILKEFHIESRTQIPFGCMSADFSVPVVAEYVVKFHIADPITIIKAEPVKQFPVEQPGQILIALEPDATGKCSNEWKTDVRIFIVSDDGRRSPTNWFRLESTENPLESTEPPLENPETLLDSTETPMEN